MTYTVNIQQLILFNSFDYRGGENPANRTTHIERSFGRPMISLDESFMRKARFPGRVVLPERCICSQPTATTTISHSLQDSGMINSEDSARR